MHQGTRTAGTVGTADAHLSARRCPGPAPPQAAARPDSRIQTPQSCPFQTWCPGSGSSRRCPWPCSPSGVCKPCAPPISVGSGGLPWDMVQGLRSVRKEPNSSIRTCTDMHLAKRQSHNNASPACHDPSDHPADSLFDRKHDEGLDPDPVLRLLRMDPHALLLEEFKGRRRGGRVGRREWGSSEECAARLPYSMLLQRKVPTSCRAGQTARRMSAGTVPRTAKCAVSQGGGSSVAPHAPRPPRML